MLSGKPQLNPPPYQTPSRDVYHIYPPSYTQSNNMKPSVYPSFALADIHHLNVYQGGSFSGMSIHPLMDAQNTPSISGGTMAMLHPSLLPPNGITPCSASGWHHFYPYQQDQVVSPADTATYSPLRTVGPPATGHGSFANASMSYHPVSPYQPASQPMYPETESLPVGVEKVDLFSRQWTGELVGTCSSEHITHFHCRFELPGAGEARVVMEDLRMLFRSKIFLVDDIPLCNSTAPYVYAYFKKCHMRDFFSCVQHTGNQASVANFIHPQRNYSLLVIIKALHLPHCLNATRPSLKQKSRRAHYQLYVEGLGRLFDAHDLFKIYSDLYKDVLSVRVFSDKNGFPNKSALLYFHALESFQKALQETPIVIKTSAATVYLKHRSYERSDNQFSRHYANATFKLNGPTFGNNAQVTRQECLGLQGKQTFPASRAYLKFLLTDGSGKQEEQLRHIYREAKKMNSSRYLQMEQEVAIYKRLQYTGYFSD